MSNTYQFIANHASQYPIAVLWWGLEVSRSGYYAWRTSPDRRCRQADGQFEAQIRQIYAASRRTYGSPLIHAELRERAGAVLKSYARAWCARSSRTTTDSRYPLPVAANLLNREFAAPAANTKWVADITYIETSEAGCIRRWSLISFPGA